MSFKDSIKCTVPPGAKHHLKESEYIVIKCRFGRRTFDVRLDDPSYDPASIADLAQAVTKETGIPQDKQKILLKGMLMDPPDLKINTVLDALNVVSGDHALILNPRRVGTDDDERRMFEEILEEVKVTDKELAEVFHGVDKVERCTMPHAKRNNPLSRLRNRAINIEKKYMSHIQAANSVHFDYRNAVDQARRREMIDICQRQLDKIAELTAAIFDRLALSNASVGGVAVYTIPVKPGPCGRLDKKCPQ